MFKLNATTLLMVIILTLTIIDNCVGKPSNYQEYNRNFEDELEADLIFNIDLIDKLLVSCKPLCDPTASTDVKFYLYTRENPTVDVRQEIKINDSQTIENSNFNYRNPTRFIVHGWNNNYESDINTIITKAYMHKSNYNIIVVDWSSCARTINYFSARCCIENVGAQIGQLIDFMNQKHKMSFKLIKVIGHSLGAHAAGFAGKTVKNGRIPSIIGLDPAMPCFKLNATHERLAVTDADYVETIHTNAGILGFLDPIGVASFYPNGGKKQPGCMLITCSHSRSYEYYAESLEQNNKFIPKKCENLDDLLKQKCEIDADHIRMGGDGKKKGKADGIFILPTNSKSPYAVGDPE